MLWRRIQALDAADSLDVQAASLYSCVSSEDNLADGVLDPLLDAVELPSPAPTGEPLESSGLSTEAAFPGDVMADSPVFQPAIPALLAHSLEDRFHIG